MDVEQFIEIVEEDVRKSGGTTNFPMERSVRFGYEQMECNGYWDDVSMSLVVARKQGPDSFLRILTHEYGHFIQWKERRAEYWILNEHPLVEELGVESLEKILWSWLGGEDQSVEHVTISCNVCRDLELDCERITLGLIKKYELALDVEDYARRANAYVYFYNVLLENRQWYMIDKEPYNIPEILEIMPTDLDGDYTTTPQNISQLMKQLCLPLKK
jgi:hypothetical protein